MGNCSGKHAVQKNDPESRGGHRCSTPKHRSKKSSLGRLAEFLSISQYGSVTLDPLSQRLPTAAAQGSQEVVKVVHSGGFMDPGTWCTGLDVPIVKARATALEKALNVVLEPAVAALTELLDGKAAVLEAVGKCQHCHWTSATLEDIFIMLPVAARMHHGVGIQNLSSAVQRMLKVLHALSQATIKAKLPIRSEIFQVKSLDALLEVLGAIAGRDVDKLDAERAWQSWQKISELLGLAHENLVVSLSAHTKALLFWLESANTGRHRVSFQVVPGRAFAEAHQQAVTRDLVGGTLGACKIEVAFPDAEQASPVMTHHGQRNLKSFFQLAGDAVCEPPPGSPGGAEQHRLFVYKKWSGCCWFNSKLKQDPRKSSQFKFIGWLLGQSFVNRVSLGIPFPHVLFVKLLEGQEFRATIEALQEFDAESAAVVRATAALKESEWRYRMSAEGLDVGINRKVYMKYAVKKILIQDVQWQFAAFTQGFFTATDYQSLKRWGLSAADLEALTCWGPNRWEPEPLSTQFRIVFEPSMARDAPALCHSFLEAIDSWSPQQQACFCQFATTSRQPDHPHMDILRIKLLQKPSVSSRSTDLLEDLPQVDESGNTVYLPNYWSAMIVAKGLMVQTDGKLPDLKNSTLYAGQLRDHLSQQLMAAWEAMRLQQMAQLRVSESESLQQMAKPVSVKDSIEGHGMLMADIAADDLKVVDSKEQRHTETISQIAAQTINQIRDGGSGSSTPQQRQLHSKEPSMVTVDFDDSGKFGTEIPEKKIVRDDFRQTSVAKQFSIGMAQDSESPLARDDTIQAVRPT